jgi:hypothetical protein
MCCLREANGGEGHFRKGVLEEISGKGSEKQTVTMRLAGEKGRSDALPLCILGPQTQASDPRGPKKYWLLSGNTRARNFSTGISGDANL